MEFLGIYRGCNDQEDDGDLDYLVDDEDKLKKYQNENVYNRLLPYDISNECRSHLMRLKASLAKCIQLDQETVYEWFIELERFVDLYGLSFTKEDHIYFVKLQYEIMINKDNMDLFYITDVARCFARLMRKRYLISIDDLKLDWRPLYEAYERLLFSETETLGLRFVPENLEPNLSQVIRLARPQFPVEATQEMLDEWRPNLYPFSQVSIQRTVTYLNLFLPTTLPPEHHDKGFKLWFDEIMQFWLSGKVGVSNESKLTLLLSRLSSDCLGYVDWEPYIPMIFNQFKANLNLNSAMNRNQAHRRSSDSADVGPYVQWMVYMINREGSCLDYIEKLFKAIESFYHPSNTDRRWHSKLQQFLYKLPSCYVKRLYRERFKKNIWSRRIPESHKLTDEQTSRLVDALLPVVVTSMFNQSGVSTAALAFRDLAILKPEKVIPPLLERLYSSYETLTEPHRLLASINCMASVVPAMVRPCKQFLEGQNHVVSLLLNSLPGIDSNDMRKCITVFRFIATLAAHVRMKDYSYLVNDRHDLTPEQQQLCLSTSQFEDFVIQFLSKCFVLIENSTSAHTFSNPDHDAQIFRSGEEGIIEAAISSVTLSILAQASKEIQMAALDKLYSHVSRNLFDTRTQGQAISTLCLACAKVLPRETLAKFVPHFGRLVLNLTENEEVFQEINLDHELTFSLLLLSEIVRCNSSYVLDHKQMIIQVLHKAFKLKSKEGYLLGCSILRHLLRALTNITCCDWRNVDSEDETIKQNEERWPFDNWGFTTNIKELKLKWEIPGEESRNFALELLETFLKLAIQDLLDWAEKKREFSREEVQRSLHIVLSSLVGAASVLPPFESPVIDINPYEVPVVPMCISYSGTDPLYFKDGGGNIRNYITESMKKVLKHIQSNYEDDTKSLGIICEIFTTSISYYGYNKSELRLAAQRIKSLKASTQNKMLGGKRHLRYLLVERVAQQQRAMLLNKGDPNFTELHLKIFECFLDLAQSHYLNVRILAQDGVYLMLNYFPFLETKLVPRLVEEFAQPHIEHKKFKGLLYLVAGRRSFSPIVLDPNWTTLSKLWPAFISSPHSEKPSIVRLIDRICNLVAKGFDTFQLRFNFSDKIKSIAAEVWSFEGESRIDQSLYPAPGEKLIQEVNDKVKIRNDNRVKNYEILVDKMAELVDNPLLHWHRRVAAYTLFAQLLREDYPLPLGCLKLCLNYLINDRLSFRTKAVQLVSAQLKLHKRKHTKRSIKTTRSKVKVPELMWKANQKIIGHKPMSSNLTELEENLERLSLHEFGAQKEEDLEYEPTLTEDFNTLGLSNRWMQYKLSDHNYTKEEWEKLIFIDKPYIGYYDWPEKLEVYESYEKQPKLNRGRDELNAYELAIFQKFNDAKFVEKLVEYFCFEDMKGSPENRRFDSKRPILFKGLFRNYGPCMIEPFRKYIVEYSTCECEQKQKFVIELLAGLIRGSKHWSFEMLIEMREFVLTILDKMTITQKNYNDWTGMTNYVFKNRDMKRLGWLLGYFINKATAPKESVAMTPFIQASRLTIAHYALIQCEWRAVSYLFPKVVDNLRGQDHLLAYANTRTCLASIYSLIYIFDDANAMSLIPGTLDNAPKRLEFINRIKSKLTILEKEKLALLAEDEASLKLKSPSDNSKDIKIGESDQSVFDPLESLVTRPAAAASVGSGGVLPTCMVASSTEDIPAVTEEAEVELIEGALIKLRQLHTDAVRDPTAGSPPGPSSSTHVERASHTYHPHRDGVKVGEQANVTPGAGSDVAQATSFVDSLRNNLPNLNVPAAHSSSSALDPTGDTPERRDAIKLMKLYCCWIIHNVFRMKSPVPADFFKLFPLICEMGRESYDPELTADSLTAVAVLGGWTLSPEAVVASLKCIRKIISDHSWHARVAAAAFMEIAVSSNLIQLICYEEWRKEIEDIVINHLICDERIEVRESSSLTLSGMIHCQFIKLSPDLIEKFKERANHQLVKRKQTSGTIVIDPKSTVIRHSGILCLCACVDAHPYTVPDHLPDILTFLSDHLTDPQPICTTIKKTMSNFRRTHHDNWQSDKTKFTEDQLCSLADLLVSPSYYA